MAKKKIRTAIPKSRAKTAYGLLSEVKRLILEEPKRYCQSYFVIWNHELSGFDMKEPPCGTVACVAGWVALTKQPNTPEHRIPTTAATILGLDASQQYELFSPLALGHELKYQTTRYAKAGAQHITRFQQKYAAQLKAKAV